MHEPKWIQPQWIEMIHHDQIQQHGGRPGLRDEALLESALMRARNRWVYEDDLDVADLAASYCIGIAKNHPFIDGNKRVAFMVMYVFLNINHFQLIAPEEEAVAIMLQVASSEILEQDLASWIRTKVRLR